MNDAFESCNRKVLTMARTGNASHEVEGEHTYHAEKPAGNSSTSYCAEDDQSKQSPRIATGLAFQKRLYRRCRHTSPDLVSQLKSTMASRCFRVVCPRA